MADRLSTTELLLELEPVVETNLNRHLATSEGRGPIRAISIGDSLPRILHGKAPLAFPFFGKGCAVAR